ncbi:MAG: hypothetical protein ABIO67_01495 [Mycobacteriales bacterium]
MSSNVRTLAVVALLGVLTGCGGSNGEQLRSDPGSFARLASLSPSASVAGSASPQPAATKSSAPPPTYVRPAGSGVATASSASAGPGRATSPQPTSPRPTPQASAGTVTVTDADSGRTIRLAIGQRLRVGLSNGTWQPPVSSDAAVLPRRSSTGGYPSDQPVDATFEATATGIADVTSQTDAACFHTEPRCMMPTRQWSVTVQVS